MKKGNDKLTLSVNKIIKERYKKFCEKNNLPTVNDVWLSRKLNQYFPVEWHVTEGKQNDNVKTWKGLKIKGHDGGQLIL